MEYGKSMSVASNALQIADQAYRNTNYDDALKSVQEGLKYCDSARSNAETVVRVDQLRKAIEDKGKTIQLAIDTRDAGARRYRDAMGSATNNWKLAVAAGTNYDSALGLLQNALKDCAAAATNQTTADTPQLVAELTKLQFELAHGREVMQREAALAAARSSFSNGDYDKAQAVCADHKGVDDFDSLAKDIALEQGALNRARQDFAAGKYTFLKDLETQRYSKKQPFADLAVNGRKEDTLLSTLINLKQATNWSAVLTQVQGASPETLKKAPFAEVNQWAQGENAKLQGQKEARKQTLDKQLAFLMAKLNVAVPASLKSYAKGVGVYESEFMSDQTRDSYSTQADSLQKKLEAEGLLNQERKNYLNTVRKHIKDWP
jgi:hypothetical protein